MRFLPPGLGLLSLFLAASYWGHYLLVPGEYRARPWLHLIGVLLLAGGAVLAVRWRRATYLRWQTKLSNWLGLAITLVIALMLWVFVFVGARLPSGPAPALGVAPAFRLPDSGGDMVELAELREQGPVVVVFFRGAFDRFARAGLADLESRRARIEKSGAHIVAICPDPPDELSGLRSQLGLGFRLLSDIDLAVARRYGLASDRSRVAHPALLLVSSTGLVEWLHFPKSASDLPHPDDVARRVHALSLR